MKGLSGVFATFHAKPPKTTSRKVNGISQTKTWTFK